MAIDNISEIEQKYFEATALLKVVRLAVEHIEQETMLDTGICETLDLVEKKRSEIYEYFDNTMKPKLTKVV